MRVNSRVDLFLFQRPRKGSAWSSSGPHLLGIFDPPLRSASLNMLISMELVTAVAKRKLASIDVIGMEEHPFELVLGKEVGKALQKVLSSLPFF
jgi:hypothetical protein